MASKWVRVFILSILQFGLVMSHSHLLRALSGKVKLSPIPVSDLVAQFRRESSTEHEMHYMSMFQIESYGDHLYYLSKNLSLECSRIIRATTMTLEKLAICEDVTSEMETAFDAAVADVLSTNESQEHPLEVLCRRVEKNFGQNSKLSSAFAAARIEAAKFDFTSHRPAYSAELLKSADSLVLKVLEMWSVPELARLVAVISFEGELDPSGPATLGVSYFIRCIVAVAKSQQFTDSMQNIFAKVLNETIPEITADDRFERISSTTYPGGLYWIPKMVKSFYGYIAQDPILKKELERVAAIIGKNASKEDINFSKL